MTPHPQRGVKERSRALVTGGAVRLGRAIALALAGDGMDVAIAYHRSARAARRTVAEIEARGVRAIAVRADLADAGEAKRLVAASARRLGGLDVLVNNAGVFVRTPFATTTSSRYDAILDVNLRGAFFCAQAAASVMRRDRGRIVNIADVGALRPAWPGYIPYTVSKAGLIAFTQALAVALRGRGIAVNCIAPGAVLPPRGLPPARWMAITRTSSATVEDVVGAVRFFATCSPSITGQVLQVDRGGA